MKKIFVLLVGVCLLMCGCGSYDQDKALKDFKNLVDNNKSYYLEGNMSIVSGEKNYSYDVNVSYKEGSYYKLPKEGAKYFIDTFTNKKYKPGKKIKVENSRHFKAIN